MLECSRSLVRKITQQFIVGVAKFRKLCIGNQLEDLFEEIYQRISCYRKKCAEPKVQDCMIIPESLCTVGKPESTPDYDHYGEYDESCHELEPSPVEEAEHEYAYASRHKIHHKQLHSIRREYKHRKKGYEIYREDHSSGKECQKIVGNQGERHHIE